MRTETRPRTWLLRQRTCSHGLADYSFTHNEEFAIPSRMWQLARAAPLVWHERMATPTPRYACVYSAKFAFSVNPRPCCNKYYIVLHVHGIQKVLKPYFHLWILKSILVSVPLHCKQSGVKTNLATSHVTFVPYTTRPRDNTNILHTVSLSFSVFSP